MTAPVARLPDARDELELPVAWATAATGIQSDNIYSNDIALTTLLQLLNPGLGDDTIANLKSITRVRCIGHILNFVSQAFLNGNNKKLLKRCHPLPIHTYFYKKREPVWMNSDSLSLLASFIS